MVITKKEHTTDGGFVYYEVLFHFGGPRNARRYVSADIWRTRFADTRSVWKIWNALKNGHKKPPIQQEMF